MMAIGVARAVKQSEPLLSLRGIEGYEGMVRSDGDRDDAIRAFLDRVSGVAAASAREDLFAAGPVILSAGGSAFYDMVADRLGNAGLGRETLVLLRSALYLTHDNQVLRDDVPASVTACRRSMDSVPGRWRHWRFGPMCRAGLSAIKRS